MDITSDSPSNLNHSKAIVGSTVLNNRTGLDGPFQVGLSRGPKRRRTTKCTKLLCCTGCKFAVSKLFRMIWPPFRKKLLVPMGWQIPGLDSGGMESLILGPACTLTNCFKHATDQGTSSSSASDIMQDCSSTAAKHSTTQKTPCFLTTLRSQFCNRRSIFDGR